MAYGEEKAPAPTEAPKRIEQGKGSTLTSPLTTGETIPISQIRIGHRHRRDMGDLSALTRSIREIGLLQPVVVTPDHLLIAGARRLAAVSTLGWMEVPARIVDLENILTGERDENVVRKDFTPTEAVAIGRAIEDRERELAKARMVAAHSSGNLPEHEKGEAREKAAAAIGMSATTYSHAKSVVDAAAENPGRFGHLVHEMDQTGKVDGPYQKLRQLNGTKPKVTAQSRIEERHERVREMARQSYRVEAIAQAVGMVEETVSNILAEAGIAPVHERIGKSKRVNAEQTLSSLIFSVTPAEGALAIINADWDSLPRDRFPEWDAELATAIQQLKALHRRIKKEL